MGKDLVSWADDQPAHDPELARLARELERVRLERNTARAAHRQAERELESLTGHVERLTALDGISVETPKWAKPKKRAGKNEATALIMLSDLHLDEVIDPAEVAGMNAYNREIALQRLQRAADGAIRLGKELLAGFDITNAVVIFGGDQVNGNLHDSEVFNETHSVIATVDYWADHLAQFLDTIASAFGPTHVVSVVGNHGRNTMKPRTNGRVQDNFDHHLTRLVQRHYRDDPRFSWNVPMSADAYVNVYDHRILVTHGDQARGGSGISGLFTPIALLDSRKRKRDQSFGRSYDHLMMGHWHQYIRGNGFTVNGSLCGVNAYAYLNNFGYEPPAQAFGIITPEHGMTIEAPIYCADRKAEGW
jgi:hypothetical protein